MATELASAYVTIIPSLKGASKTIQGALSGVNTSSVGKSAGKSYGSGFGVSLGGLAKAAVGVLGGIATAKVLQGGITRALNIEQAQFKFKALGMDVEQTMASCNDAVTGTAYGLDAAATVASMFGAAGVTAGDQMTNALKSVAGVAAMSGDSMENIGSIFTKVAAKGKLSGDELVQLSERGVNATAALASHLGKSSEEVSKMVSSGQIDFQTFSDAMYATFGEAASGANETFQGAMSNVSAAINRITAKFASPALEGLRKVFVALIPAINAVSNLLDPLVEKFAAFVDVVADKAVASIEAFTNALSNGGSIVDGFMAGLSALVKGTAIEQLITFAANCVSLFQSAATPMEGFRLVLERIKGAVSGFSGDALAAFFASLPQPIQDVITKVREFASTPLGSYIIDMAAKLAVFGASFGLLLAKFGGPLKTAVTAVGGFVSKLGGLGGIITTVGHKLATFMLALTLNGGGIKGLATTIGGALRGAFVGLRGALMGLFSPATLVVGAILAIGAAFVAMMATNEGFRNTVMSLVSSIGSSLAPILETVKTALQQLATTVLPVIMGVINALVPILAQVVVVVLQVVAAIAPVIAQIAGALIPVITTVISVVANVLAAVMPAVTAILSVVLSVISAIIPAIGNVLSVVGSVVSGIVSFIGMVLSVVGNIVAVVVGVVSSVIGAVVSVFGVIATVFANILSVVTGVIATVVSCVSSGFQTAQNIVSSVANAIGSFVSGLFNTIASIFGKIVSTVSNACSNAFETARSAFNNIVTAVSGAVGRMMSAVGEIPGKIKGFFSDAGSWLLGAGKAIIQGLWNGISSAKDWLAGKLSGIGDFIAAHKGPKQYDLKLLVPNGQWIMESLTQGIENGIPGLEKTLSGVTEGIQGFGSEVAPFDDVSADVRAWSNAEFVSEAERSGEQAAMIQKALSSLGDRIENLKIVMDSGELVGATAAKYDKAQGRRQLLAERGF